MIKGRARYLISLFYQYRLRDRGVLIGRDGPGSNVLKVKPPMVITKDDITHFVNQLDAVLTELEKEDEEKEGNPTYSRTST